MSSEMFPHSITGAFSSDRNTYYFFRGSKYCIRNIFVNNNEISTNEMTRTNEVYKIDSKGNTQLVHKSGVSH